MKLPLLNKSKTEIAKIDLPIQFEEEIRPDLISRAVWTTMMNKKQPYGAFPMAGKGYSAYISKRRRAFRTIYGSGSSRTPRKTLSRSGRRLNWVGAFAPHTVGGRRSHPPKSIKIWDRKLSVKENQKAIRSAISSTVIREIVEERGHYVPKEFPFILDDSITKAAKTKEAVEILEKLGFKEELKRVSERKIRAGKGKSRGRKYKFKTGPLIVIKNECELQKSALNIPGIEVITVKRLSAQMLAPGGIPGRLTIWTKGAIESLEKEKLFM